MGLFSKKTDDTKARIEELKKKIQAEQQAYTAQASAPVAPPAAPAPAPAPAPVMAQPQQIIIEERTPVQMVQPTFSQSPQPRHHNQNAPMPQHHSQDTRRELGIQQQYDRAPRPMHQEMHLDANNGIVLDLGEGMSLNVPVKTRMRLDDFLALADKVRELQSLQQRPAFR